MVHKLDGNFNLYNHTDTRTRTLTHTHTHTHTHTYIYIYGHEKLNGIASAWNKKKGKTSKFVDAERNNWNERKGNQQHEMDRQERMKMKNKIKILGTERCKNIDTLHKKVVYTFEYIIYLIRDNKIQ